MNHCPTSPNTPRVSLHTLGCKLNQAEAELLAADLGQAGYQVVAPGAANDIYILNTCTVTHIADRKARHLLRLARRLHPHSLIVATGCYAQRAPTELEATGAVDLVVPQSDKPELVANLAGLRPSASPSPTPPLPWGRTRSYIKIQDGCHDGCAYCIVPRVRGREYSLPPDSLIDQVKARVAQGYREVVLTGTKIGGYSWDGYGLSRLVARILGETGVERLRLSSLQPQELTPQLLALWADPRLCRHLHIPLQSGSDEVLASMRRGYRADGFRRAVGAVRQAVPDIAITTDIMVGFPGERETDFQDSLALCQEVGFAAVHIFPYSPRPGTRAAAMGPGVEARVKNERALRLRQLAGQGAMSYREGFLGTVRPVLWEQEIAPGLWSGLTDNYLRVFAHGPSGPSVGQPVGPSSPNGVSESAPNEETESAGRTRRTGLANQITPVRLTGLRDGVVWGEISPHSLSLAMG